MKGLITVCLLFFSSLTFSKVELLKPSVDLMEDTKTQSVAIISSEDMFAGKPDVLFLRKDCNSGDIEIILYTNWVVEDSDVKIRFDKEEVETVSVSRSTDYKALFLDLESESAVTKMKEHSRLIVRYVQSGGGSITPVFSLKGFTKALSKICK